jgi:hypothetical protein
MRQETMYGGNYLILLSYQLTPITQEKTFITMPLKLPITRQMVEARTRVQRDSIIVKMMRAVLPIPQPPHIQKKRIILLTPIHNSHTNSII